MILWTISNFIPFFQISQNSLMLLFFRNALNNSVRNIFHQLYTLFQLKLVFEFFLYCKIISRKTYYKEIISSDFLSLSEIVSFHLQIIFVEINRGPHISCSLHLIEKFFIGRNALCHFGWIYKCLRMSRQLKKFTA